MSDRIEAFILELMRQDQENSIRIQRNELAQLFGCVPSQINYVISTRFSPDKGYVVQSRRGGGGCVMISKAKNGEGMTARDAIGQVNALAAGGYLSRREAALLGMAMSDEVLTGDADEIRARLMDQIRRFLK